VTEQTAAFANALIFDGVSAELRDGCVRVAAGTILAVGEGPEPGDRVIDCRGRTIVPGLIDAHFHAYAARLSITRFRSGPGQRPRWSSSHPWAAIFEYLLHAGLSPLIVIIQAHSCDQIPWAS
jgi:cytosine/adenosine deaminase-related metal-dependent hydrolase